MADNDGWEEIASNNTDLEMHNFETDTVLIGQYVGMKSDVGPNKSRIYEFAKDGQEEHFTCWGATALDSKMDEVPLKSTVKIEYLGKVQGKTNRYKDFKVSVKKQSVNDGLGEVA